jgi:hypothetical protein
MALILTLITAILAATVIVLAAFSLGMYLKSNDKDQQLDEFSSAAPSRP